MTALRQAQGTDTRIDISHLPNGVYLLKINNSFNKFVVVK